MTLLEATRFLKDALGVVDGAQLAALRLGLVGIGIILLLILRPQGLFAEPRKRVRDFFPNDDVVADRPAAARSARAWAADPSVPSFQHRESEVSSRESQL